MLRRDSRQSELNGKLHANTSFAVFTYSDVTVDYE